MLNPQKTELIHFVKDFNYPPAGINLESTLNFQDIVIKPTIKVKYLRLLIDSNLNFNLQVNSIIQKMAVATRSLIATQDNFTAETRLLLFKALILSQHNYACN